MTDKETKVVSATNSVNLDLLRERHSHWVAQLLTLQDEWPGVRLSSLCGSEGQVPTRSKGMDLKVLLREEGDLCGHMDILVVAKSELASLITAPYVEVM